MSELNLQLHLWQLQARFAVEVLLLRLAYMLIPSRRFRFEFLKAMFAEAHRNPRTAYYRNVIRKAVCFSMPASEVLVVAVCLLAFILRAWRLDAAALSYDESFTRIVSSSTLHNLILATAGDVHPPLFYVLEWWVIKLNGPTNFALRYLPAAFGLLSVYLVRSLAIELDLDERAEFAAMLLTAILPFQLHYSQDARMYTLLQFLVLLSLCSVYLRQWLFLAGCGVALFYTHNYAVIYWPVIAGLAIVRELMGTAAHPNPNPAYPAPILPKTNFAGLWAATLLPIVFYLPWVGVMIGQMSGLGNTGYWIQPLTLGQFLYPFYMLWWGTSLPSPLAEVGALLAFGLLAFALIKAARTRDPAAIILAWLVTAPAIFAAAVSLIWQPIYLFRALIGIAVPMYLLVGWAITHRAKLNHTAFALACLVLIAIAGLVNRGNQQVFKGPQTIAQDYIAEHAQPGDIVYHGNVSSFLGFSASGYPDLPQYLMPEQPGSVGTLTAQTRQALGIVEAPLSDLQWRRVWLVWGAVPTIAEAEDRAIADILETYPNGQVIDLDLLFTGDNATVDGGVWLIYSH